MTNKQGHTLHWSVSNYVNDIETYLGRKVDIILVNNEMPSEEQVNHYKMEEGDGVLTIDDMKDDVRVVRENLLSKNIVGVHAKDAVSHLRSFIRHDKDAFREAIMKLL